MTERDLLSRARAARDAAYAPYSGFQVGAALETSDGSVFAGCNVENASYGLTLCAERAAVAAAVTAGHRSFVGLALSVSGDGPVAPCGACLQVLAEFAPEVSVVSEGGGAVRRWRLEELLSRPFGFRDGFGSGEGGSG